MQKGYIKWRDSHEAGHLDISVLSWFDPVRLALSPDISSKSHLLFLHRLVCLHRTALPGFPIIGARGRRKLSVLSLGPAYDHTGLSPHPFLRCLYSRSEGAAGEEPGL